MMRANHDEAFFEQNQPKTEKYVKVIEGRRKGGEGVQELM